eukprot:SAG22_NODE_12540_length_438_cov_1.345133_1_plen_61_part_10
MFLFYNTVLRARGGIVPYGDVYPTTKGADTAGRLACTATWAITTRPSDYFQRRWNGGGCTS